MKLTITTGMVTVPIERDGEVTGRITFDPSDVRFCQGLYELLTRYEESICRFHDRASGLDPEDAEGYFALLNGVTDDLRESIDRLFGSGTAEAAFGSTRNPDVMGQFIDALSAIVREARSGKLSRYLPGAAVTEEDGLA